MLVCSESAWLLLFVNLLASLRIQFELLLFALTDKAAPLSTSQLKQERLHQSDSRT